MSYRELADRLRTMQPQREFFCCGKVLEVVDGLTCIIEVGKDKIEANLRPTELQQDGELLIVPKIGSAVVLGCLNGDYNQMIVLAMDVAEQIIISGNVTINGGKLGGMVNVGMLTDKLNAFVDTFNAHTHIGNMGAPTAVPAPPANPFVRGDYEDNRIKH